MRFIRVEFIDGPRSRTNGCLSNNEANGSNNKEENKPIKKSRSHQKSQLNEIN